MSQTPSNDDLNEDDATQEDAFDDLGDELNLDDLDDSGTAEAEELGDDLGEDLSDGLGDDLAEDMASDLSEGEPASVGKLKRPDGVYTLLLVVSLILVGIALGLSVLELSMYRTAPGGSSPAVSRKAAPAKAPAKAPTKAPSKAKSKS